MFYLIRLYLSRTIGNDYCVTSCVLDIDKASNFQTFWLDFVKHKVNNCSRVNLKTRLLLSTLVQACKLFSQRQIEELKKELEDLKKQTEDLKKQLEEAKASNEKVEEAGFLQINYTH